MKTIYLIPIGFIFILLSLVSCEKDTSAIGSGLTAYDTIHVYDTVRIHDTIRIHDTVAPVPLTRTQILVQKDWIIDEISQSISGLTSHYVRGGVNTTGVNYTNLKIHFNADGTGTYIDETGGPHTLNWSFTSTDQRNMHLIVGAPFANTFDWNMVELKDNYLHATAMQGSNILVAARYIQVP